MRLWRQYTIVMVISTTVIYSQPSRKLRSVNKKIGSCPFKSRLLHFQLGGWGTAAPGADDFVKSRGDIVQFNGRTWTALVTSLSQDKANQTIYGCLSGLKQTAMFLFVFFFAACTLCGLFVRYGSQIK